MAGKPLLLQLIIRNLVDKVWEVYQVHISIESKARPLQYNIYKLSY